MLEVPLADSGEKSVPRERLDIAFVDGPKGACHRPADQRRQVRSRLQAPPPSLLILLVN